MILDILKPTAFHGPLDKGGSTKPWKVSLLQADGLEVPYVVKLFTENNIIQQHAVAKEIYGNVLAREFSLPVPDIALVELDDFFVENVLDKRYAEVLKLKDGGLKFSSKLADSMIIVSPELYKNFLKEYDIANVYAFDTLIGNIDRGGFRSKPNLIVDDENFMLIDHEQIFTFADTHHKDGFMKIFEDFENNKISYPFQRHLLYPLLKSLRTNEKRHLFDEFGEYLSKMQTIELEETINQLNRLEVSTGNYALILNYLYKIKQQYSKFCYLLLASVT